MERNVNISRILLGATGVVALIFATKTVQACGSYDSYSYQSSGCLSSTASASLAAQNEASRVTSGLVQGRISSITSSSFGGAPGSKNKQTGLIGWSEGRGAAGSVSGPKLGIWGDIGYASFQDSSAVVNSDGSVWAGAFGADYLVHPHVILGLAGTIEGVSSTASAIRMDIDSKGYGITPYAAVKITDIFSASALFSYVWSEVDATRALPATTLYGSTNARRATTAATVSANTNFGNFTFGGDLGLMYTATTQEALRMDDTAGTSITTAKSTSEMGTLSLAAQPGYLIELDRKTNTWIEPYARFEYRYDFVNTDIAGHPNDDDVFTIGGGFNVFTDGNVALSAGASTDLGRENYSGVSANLTARVAF